MNNAGIVQKIKEQLREHFPTEDKTRMASVYQHAADAIIKTLQECLSSAGAGNYHFWHAQILRNLDIDQIVQLYEALASRITESTQLTNIFTGIAVERARQDQKWGGPETDDMYTPLDWHEMIADYNGWARRMAAMGDDAKARNRYIQIAALAVAAIEALDRRQKKGGK